MNRSDFFIGMASVGVAYVAASSGRFRYVPTTNSLNILLCLT
ncbi:hypothetical protein [Priestia megaterium]